MKRINLFAIALFASAAILWGKDNPEMLFPPPSDPIVLHEILVPPPPPPKSGVVHILASYVQETCEISLCISEPQGPMVVTIKNESGQVVLQETVDGNQPEVDIPLPTLQIGCYSITIQSKLHLLAGVF